MPETLDLEWRCAKVFKIIPDPSTMTTKLLGLLETSLQTFETVNVSQEVVNGEKGVTLSIQVVDCKFSNNNNNNNDVGMRKLAINLIGMLKDTLTSFDTVSLNQKKVAEQKVLTLKVFDSGPSEYSKDMLDDVECAKVISEPAMKSMEDSKQNEDDNDHDNILQEEAEDLVVKVKEEAEDIKEDEVEIVEDGNTKYYLSEDADIAEDDEDASNEDL